MRNSLKLLSLFLIGIGFSLIVNGQSSSVQWGAPGTSSDVAMAPDKLIHHDDQQTIIMRSKMGLGKEMLVEKYDASMKPVDTFGLYNAGVLKGKSYLSRDAFFAHGKVIALFDGNNDDANTNHFAFSVFESDGTPVTELNEILNHPRTDKRKSGDYFYGYSENGNYLCVVYVPPFEKEKQEQYEFNLFNTSDFSLVRSNKFTGLAFAERFPLLEVHVDNNGNIYSTRPLDAGKGNQGLFCMFVDQISGQVTTSDLGLPGVHLVQRQWLNNAKGNLQLVGTWNTPDGFASKKVEGLFMVEFNGAANATKTSINTLPTEILSKYNNAKQMAKPHPALDDFALQNVLQRADGQYYIVLENQHENKNTSTSPNGQTVTHFQFIFKELMALLVNDKAEVQWTRYLGKQQEYKGLSQINLYAGCISSTYNNRLVVVWNYVDRAGRLDVKPIGYGYEDDNGGKHNIGVDFGGMTYYAPFEWILDIDGTVLTSGLYQSQAMISTFKLAPYEMGFNMRRFFNVGDGKTIVFAVTPANDGVKYTMGMMTSK